MDYSKKLLEIFSAEIIDIFKNTIDKYCKNKRTPKYTTEYYLYNIILVLRKTSSWSSINEFNDKKPYHYKTISKMHLKWSKLNIYNIVYNELLNKYILNKLKGSSNLTLFIDSSNIYNKYGIDEIGYGQNPKKRESKISVICDNDKNVYSLTLVKANNKIINEKVIRKTLPNDSKTISSSVDDLLKNKLKYKKLNLVGDKGYALNKTDKDSLFKDHNIELVYPHKKNQKEKTSKEHKKLLQNRYKIENVFCKLKSFDRICFRKDKLGSTYLGFCFLALIITFKN